MEPARKELLDRIGPASQNIGPARFLIYGPKGAGKTVFCARAKDCLVLDTEDSRRSIMNHPELANVPVLPVKHFNDMDEVGWAIKEGDLTCKTLIVDTMDKLADDTVSYLLDKAVAASNGARDPFAASQAEYRVRNELFKRLTADWSGLGVNLVFTAHVTEVKEESSGTLRLRPSLSGAMSDSMGGYVTLQGYLTLEEADDVTKWGTPHLQVHPSRRVDAKTRIGGLPRTIDNPSIQDLIDAHYGPAKLPVYHKGDLKP